MLSISLFICIIQVLRSKLERAGVSIVVKAATYKTVGYWYICFPLKTSGKRKKKHF